MHVKKQPDLLQLSFQLTTDNGISCQVCFVLFNDTWSQRGHLVSYISTLFSILADHQIRHLVTCEVDSQSGDCSWSDNLSQAIVSVCVG